MNIFKQREVWFVIGSQHLYGPKTLQQVMENAEQVVNSLNRDAGLPVKMVLKPLVTTPDEITTVCRDANYHQDCVGIITWLHTFSPAKCGLQACRSSISRCSSSIPNLMPRFLGQHGYGLYEPEPDRPRWP